MNRLKEIRKQKGLTLNEVGEKVGLKNNTLSQYENNKRQPRLETWQKLADFFGVSVSYLQGLEPDLYTLTPETKELVISKLNTFYFAENGKELTASIDPIERVKDAVNEYAKLAKITPLPSELKRKSQKEKNAYLNKYFSFLFEDAMIIVMFNEYLYSYYPTSMKKSRESRLANRLAKSIEEYTIQEFETKFGMYFNKIYGLKLQQAYTTFQRKLNFCKDIGEIKGQFDSYIKLLKEIEETTSRAVAKSFSDAKAYSTTANLIQHDKELSASMKKLDSLNNVHDQMKFVKDYLIKNKKEVPKEISDYLEKYSNK